MHIRKHWTLHPILILPPPKAWIEYPPSFTQGFSSIRDHVRGVQYYGDATTSPRIRDREIKTSDAKPRFLRLYLIFWGAIYGGNPTISHFFWDDLGKSILGHWAWFILELMALMEICMDMVAIMQGYWWRCSWNLPIMEGGNFRTDRCCEFWRLQFAAGWPLRLQSLWFFKQKNMEIKPSNMELTEWGFTV